MKKMILFLSVFSLVVFTSCKKEEPEKPKDPVYKVLPDPTGTVSKDFQNTSEFIHFTTGSLQYYLGWKKPNHLTIGHPEYGCGIYDIGEVKCLANITSIPAYNNGYGWKGVKDCKFNHGYVGRYLKEFNSATDMSKNTYEYVRLYVEDRIVNERGELVGVRVKYQYPFVPK